MKKALILANGETPSKRLIQTLKKSVDLFVCADGGANIAQRLKLRPDVIIGDLDSVFASTLKRFPHAQQVHLDDQNSTDLEKAVSWVIDQGYDEIVVTGTSGKRIDHTIGNLGVLVKFHKHARISFIHDDGELLFVGRKIEVSAEPGTLISLLPLNRCEGVTTQNLKYPLNHEVLELGFRDGTSNEVISNPIRITVEKGNLLLFLHA